MKARFVYKGGEGSGFFGHSGRPGKVGGSMLAKVQKPISRADVISSEDDATIDKIIAKANALDNPKAMAKLHMPKILYHVTHKKNKKAIKAGGLQKGAVRGTKADEGVILGVYMTDMPAETFEEQDFTYNYEDAIVVAIDVSKLDGDIHLDPEYFYWDDTSQASVEEYIDMINKGEESYAFYSRGNIPASAIHSIKKLSDY